jgi:hypothetical protein
MLFNHQLFSSFYPRFLSHSITCSSTINSSPPFTHSPRCTLFAPAHLDIVVHIASASDVADLLEEQPPGSFVIYCVCNHVVEMTKASGKNQVKFSALSFIEADFLFFLVSFSKFLHPFIFAHSLCWCSI